MLFKFLIVTLGNVYWLLVVCFGVSAICHDSLSSAGFLQRCMRVCR